MLSQTDIAIIVTDQEAASALAGRSQDGTFTTHERRNLDGRAAEWVVLGGATLSGLRLLLETLLRYTELKKVKSLKLGDLEIDNPRNEDVTRLIEHYVRTTDLNDSL